MTTTTTAVPTHTSVWYKSSSMLKSTTTLYLGETKATPTHLLQAKLHVSGKSELTLHAGPEPTTAILAHTESKHACSTDSRLSITVPGQPAHNEPFAAHMRLTTERYDFVLQVPSGAVEKFEWRMSKGDEVKALHGFKYGFKLVRLGEKFEGPNVSGDGHEVVAAWAEPANLKTECGRLELLGSAADGQLGEAFNVAAVITAVRIWQLRFLIATVHVP